MRKSCSRGATFTKHKRQAFIGFDGTAHATEFSGSVFKGFFRRRREDPRMIESLSRSDPFFRVDSEQLSDQILGRRREVSEQVLGIVAALYFGVVGLGGGGRKGHFTGEHDEEDAAEGPGVDGEGVGLVGGVVDAPGGQLGGQVGDGADELGEGLLAGGGQAEVDDLDVVGVDGFQHEVLGLEIAVDDAHFVDVGHAQQDLAEGFGGGLFGVLAAVDEALEELAADDVLHDHGH